MKWQCVQQCEFGWITRMKETWQLARCLSQYQGVSSIFSCDAGDTTWHTRWGKRTQCLLYFGRLFFCQGVGWLRLDKRHVCVVLAPICLTKASQGAAYVYILDLWLSCRFYSCLDAPTQSVRLDVISLRLPGDQELRLRVPFYICFF